MKVRIGYLSDTFCEGRSKDLYPAFFTVYDKYRFEVYGYNCGKEDQITRMFAESADAWRNLGIATADEIAARIQQDRINLLVDLSYARPSNRVEDILAKVPVELVYPNRKDKWCYTPFSKVADYVAAPPCLEQGKITFALWGTVMATEWPSLGQRIREILQACPQGKLLGRLQDLQVLCQQGIQPERLVVWEEGELPFSSVDIALGTTAVNGHMVCQLADHGIPVVVLAQPDHPEICYVMKQLDQSMSCVEQDQEYARAAIRLAEDKQELCRQHQLLHWQLHASALMDAGQFMIDREQQYDRWWFARQLRHRPEALVRQLVQAEKKRDWENCSWLIAELDSWGQLPLEQEMTAAWTYFFLKDDLRSYYWAKRASRDKAPKQMTQYYLQAEALVGMHRWQELWQLYEHFVAQQRQGEQVMPRIRFNMLMKGSAMAYRLGKPQMTDIARETYLSSELFEDRCTFFSSWLMAFNCQDTSSRDVYEKHCGYRELFTDIQPYKHTHHRKKAKLRIGYISPDFRAHVMSYFCWPFLATFNHDQFEVYVYSLGATDQYTDTFQTLVTKWRDMRNQKWSDIAQQIYTDEVDILFDLAGHTARSGLPVLAWKPAPVQLSGLGYMTTTGLPQVDYFVTDAYVDPAGLNDEFFSEKLLRLTSQFCYNGAVNLPESAGTPARARGSILFGVFNQYTKINDEMLRAWRCIMERVPRSKLLLKGEAFADARTALAAYVRLQGLGFDMNRVLFEAASRDYMQRYLDVDIALDTYPYPGGGTTCDALYMGVPVITRYSTRHSTRFSYGILSVVGLSELASTTLEEYVEKATVLAQDLDLLDGLHRNLRSMMKQSALMDSVGYIQEVEQYYHEIWRKYEAEQNG